MRKRRLAYPADSALIGPTGFMLIAVTLGAGMLKITIVLGTASKQIDIPQKRLIRLAVVPVRVTLWTPSPLMSTVEAAVARYDF